MTKHAKFLIGDGVVIMCRNVRNTFRRAITRRDTVQQQAEERHTRVGHLDSSVSEIFFCLSHTLSVGTPSMSVNSVTTLRLTGDKLVWSLRRGEYFATLALD